MKVISPSFVIDPPSILPLRSVVNPARSKFTFSPHSPLSSLGFHNPDDLEKIKRGKVNRLFFIKILDLFLIQVGQAKSFTIFNIQSWLLLCPLNSEFCKISAAVWFSNKIPTKKDSNRRCRLC